MSRTGWRLGRRAPAFVVAAAVAGAIAVASEPPAGATAGAGERLAIDATAVGAPISPFIYGQFIEHLGRCIYGGLWAEMLEDRKFFYPVTGDAPAWEMFTPGPRSWDGEGHPYELLVRSPWLILGDKKAVAMVREGALAGAHSPALRPAGAKGAAGLMQERLALRDGRDYVGRIVLAGQAAPASASASTSASASSSSAAAASAAVVEVSLVWGGGASARQTIVAKPAGATWTTIPLGFRAGGTTDNGRLEIVVRGAGGAVRVGAVSLMPADNVRGWRRDTLALLRELDAPVYRWPGGNFVSGYDWKDGVGDPDRRPPRKNPAWKGVEPNDVGLHEFMDLMGAIGAAPYVAVNTGLGGARAAAELVAYANGAPDTPMGRLRARNGHPRPFDVRLWAVGNEMYGEWQLGHMPIDRYVAKHREIVEAMRAADPRRPLDLVAVGAVGDWSRAMLAQAASHMTFISEHHYWQAKDDVPAHVAQVPDEIRRIAAAHRAYRRELPALAGKDVKVALDEWNYWYGANEYGELGTRYFLQDGLGIAAGLHELYRNSDLFYMANYAQTVNVIGAIKTTADAAELEATGLALALYRRHFGSLPVAVRAPPDGLDVAAAWTADRKALTIAVVNPDPARARTLRLELTGARPSGAGRLFVLTGAGARAYNAPGRPRGVTVTETPLAAGAATLSSPPLSVSLFVLEAAR